jgi:hypothetical protein
MVHLDWPRERLQVQVLDDSTDRTTTLTRRRVDECRRQGVDITLYHRRERAGYKAGALNAALQSARGTFIAVFDADFIPSPDFLKRTVPYLAAEPQLGFVQTRWGHLNDTFSLVTLAQALALDAHFAIEHIARERAGWMTNFSGTGGVWRRECIEACGGWDPEILTEDVDLSYRAQLEGWKGMTVPDVVTPAELPVQVSALKRQQFRWAKGNTQCLLKLGGAILRAQLPLPARIQALAHLSSYLGHILMLGMLISTFPLLWGTEFDIRGVGLMGLAALGPPFLYTVGQYVLYSNWWRRLRALPVLILIGVGLALSSTRAVAEAVLGIRSPFERTPKFRIEGRNDHWDGHSYVLPLRGSIWGELALALCAALLMVAALRADRIQTSLFLLLYSLGFGFVSLTELIQSFRGSSQTSSIEGQFICQSLIPEAPDTHREKDCRKSQQYPRYGQDRRQVLTAQDDVEQAAHRPSGG